MNEQLGRAEIEWCASGDTIHRAGQQTVFKGGKGNSKLLIVKKEVKPTFYRKRRKRKKKKTQV